MTRPKDNRYCLICQPRNRTLYWHKDEQSGDIWCWCNKCERGYSLRSYCHKAGISLIEFLAGEFHYEEARPNEVSAMNWPLSFIPISDPRANKGVEYIKSRGLSLEGDFYYDIENEGIVFPYYYGQHFCGAQVRFIETRLQDDGKEWKITTTPGTRLGLLFGLWNQDNFLTDIKVVVVCEGYFNALSLQQAFNHRYGGVSRNPWKFCCASGSGVSDHQAETLKDLKDKGFKVICAGDTDEAGFKMIAKMKERECITHFATTGDPSKDWNNLLQDMGHDELAAYFLSCINKI
jgi:hypothetical protein